MADVQYLWRDASSALRTVQQWESLGIFFVETPLHTDNLDGYAVLVREALMRIAAGEWLTTRFDLLGCLIEDNEVARRMLDVLVVLLRPDVYAMGG